MTSRLSLLACAFLVGAPVSAPAQARALMRGSVVDDADDHPIAGAVVSIESLRRQVTTDSAGGFILPSLPAGRHIFTVKRLGYSPITAVVNIKATDTLDYDFALVKNATPLPQVDVKTAAPVPPKLVEFEERRVAGFGRFITPDVLEKNKERHLSEVIATLPGPRIMRGWGGNGWVASSVGPSSIQRHFKPGSADLARGADPNQCYAAVMLDGSPVFTGRNGEQLFDINSIATSNVAAIEYYRDAATVPMKFNIRGEETCGLVVIWTK